jgi:hypothetical protein
MILRAYDDKEIWYQNCSKSLRKEMKKGRICTKPVNGCLYAKDGEPAFAEAASRRQAEPSEAYPTTLV